MSTFRRRASRRSTTQFVLSSTQESGKPTLTGFDTGVCPTRPSPECIIQDFVPLTIEDLERGLSPEQITEWRQALNFKAFGQRLAEVC